MKKERKQFSEQDYVSNEETPVETRDGRHVEILDIDVNHPSRLRVRGQIDGEQPNDRRWSPEGKYFEDRDHEYDLFFKNTKLESTPLNLAKLLKDAPKGTKLYSPIFGECEFNEVNEDRRDDRIEIIYYSTGVYKRLSAYFCKDGTYSDLGECLLFPSRDNHDWRTFKVEKGFEVGDQQKKPDRTVKCVYCGREFIKPIPHRCNKNYRKRKLKWINLMEMEEERKQFNVQDFVSNKETPVETRNGHWVEIMNIDDKGDDPVKGRVEGVYYESWGSDGKGILKGDDLFFKKLPLNLAKLLRDVPKGTRLYSPLFNEVILDEVVGDKIRVITKDGNKYGYYFYKRGNFIRDTGECLLFPSKENRDWSNWSTMKTKQQFKLIPFDLSKARTPENPGGLEVVTRDNKCRIRIICTDRYDSLDRYPIIALYSYLDGGDEFVAKWQRNGKFAVGDGEETRLDLFLKQPILTNQEHHEEPRECMYKDKDGGRISSNSNNAKKEERRQFNVQDYISDIKTPVETRDGRAVKINKFRVNASSPLLPDFIEGFVEGNSDIIEWDGKGRFSIIGEESEYDLFFKTLGKSNDKRN